jgi:hypothetical protein
MQMTAAALGMSLCITTANMLAMTGLHACALRVPEVLMGGVPLQSGARLHAIMKQRPAQ